MMKKKQQRATTGEKNHVNSRYPNAHKQKKWYLAQAELNRVTGLSASEAAYNFCVFTTFRMTIHKGVNYAPHLHDMMIICLMWDLAMLCEQKSTKNLASMCFREQRIIVTEQKEY